MSMFRLLRSFLFFALLLSSSPLLSAQPGTDKEALAAALAEVQRLPRGDRRLKALHRLSTVKGAAPHLVKVLQGNASDALKVEKELAGLRKRYEALRTKGDEALETLRGDIEVLREKRVNLTKEADFLVESVAKGCARLPDEARKKFVRLAGRQATQGRGDDARVAWIRVLARLGTPPCFDPLAAALRSKDAGIRNEVARALRSCPTSEAAERLLITLLDDAESFVQRSAASSLAAVGDRAAVDALIARVDKHEGLLGSEIVLSLRKLCGVNYHDNRALWEQWWKGARNGFTPRSSGFAVGGDAKGTSFYGIRTPSRSLVYLLDVSGSMNEPAVAAGVTSSGPRDETKLQRMKREVIRSIKGLPSGAWVNLVTYSDSYRGYARRMTRLDETTRRAIIAWVRNLEAHGKTNIFDPLEMVLLSRDQKRRRRKSDPPVPDTVFLLTDGLPTAGQLIDADLISAEVEKLNRRAGMMIHTIGIGRDHARQLLQSIAADSGGRYVSAR